MKLSDKEYKKYVSILEEELVPAMGCTEPIALAYAAAKCKEVLGAKPTKIEVLVSGSIIKNVKSVIVPNTGGLKGIEASVAVGIVAGDPSKELEVISQVTEDEKLEIKDYMEKTDIRVEHLHDGFIFDIIVIGYFGDDWAKVRIANYHTNIVLIEKNGEKILEKEVVEDSEEGLTDRSTLSMESIWEFATTCDIEVLRPLLEKQIEYNMAIAEVGLKEDHGANVGSVMLETYGDELRNRVVAKAAAGSDARMDGSEMPVIINAGSGNQGITCSVPVIEYARGIEADDEKLLRALILSNLIAIYQSVGIGRLSAFCGVVSAGTAAVAGITYLRGGGLDEINHTVINSLATSSGVVCDGAKASCASKIALSLNMGLLASDMYAMGNKFNDGDGLVAETADDTIDNIGRLAREGMSETNKEIMKMMIE